MLYNLLRTSSLASSVASIADFVAPCQGKIVHGVVVNAAYLLSNSVHSFFNFHWRNPTNPPPSTFFIGNEHPATGVFSS